MDEPSTDQLRVNVEVAAFRLAVATWLPGHSDVAVDKAFAQYLAQGYPRACLTREHSEWAIKALQAQEPPARGWFARLFRESQPTAGDSDGR